MNTTYVDLGLAILMARSETGESEPVAVVSTRDEARETADEDFMRRQDELEEGGDPMCPIEYQLWTRDAQGTYRCIDVWPA